MDNRKKTQCKYFGAGFCMKNDKECPYGHFLNDFSAYRRFGRRIPSKRKRSRKSRSKTTESSVDLKSRSRSCSKRRESRVRSNSESSNNFVDDLLEATHRQVTTESKRSKNLSNSSKTIHTSEKFIRDNSKEEEPSTTRQSNSRSRSLSLRISSISQSKSPSPRRSKSSSKSPSGKSVEGFMLSKEKSKSPQPSSKRRKRSLSESSIIIIESDNKESEQNAEFLDRCRPQKLSNETIMNLRKEFDDNLYNFSVLGDFVYGDNCTKFDVYKWQKEILMYQLYLPANQEIRRMFSISKKHLIDPSFEDMINAKFDLIAFNRHIFKKLKKWDKLDFAEQYINNNGIYNYRTDDLELYDGSLFKLIGEKISSNATEKESNQDDDSKIVN